MSTTLVLRDRIIPHPDNPNKMPAKLVKKLAANIEANQGRYPPLIVRTLECSSFVEECAGGKLQLIDGEQRLAAIDLLGYQEIEVMIWTGITDKKAKELLAVFAAMQGDRDKKKRAELLRELAQDEGIDMMAMFMPETEEELARIVEQATAISNMASAEATEDRDRSISSAMARAENLNHVESLTVFASSEDAAIIRKAIRLGKERYDLGDVEHGEGLSLAQICRAYLTSHGE